MDYTEAIQKFSRDASHIALNITEDADGVVVLLGGSLDLQSSSALQELLLRIIDSMATHKRLVIDLNDLNYIPSNGVGALTVALTLSRKRDIHLQLSRIKPKVRSIFELLGFMSFFEEADIDA